MKTYWKCG